MSSSGGFPLDLVLFGMIAAFLVLRLRSILGRRTGFERPPEPQMPASPNAQPTVSPRSAADGHVIEGSPPGQAFGRMQHIDHSFDAARFLDGAEAAFRIIVTAFAAGDRARLRPLLADDTYGAFAAAITARETAGETQRTEIHAIEAATIETADLRGSIADVVVRFVSDQVNMTLGSDGNPMMGTDAVTEITDQWTFERDLTSSDPTWRLVAARSA
jgi:predicted lipid-binding transport protein (Tim44 family)